MVEVPKVQELTELASFLAPGFIVVAMRNRFKDGSVPDVGKNAILYAFVSSAYYAAASPFFNVPWGLSLWPWLWSLLQYFICPLIVGISWVVIDQKEWFYKACAYFDIAAPHHVPTAWDWTFGVKRKPSYVSITLKDGKIYHGTWTEKSFASSSNKERDIYLDEEWAVDEHGAWTALDPRRAILICSKDVSAIEIIGERA